MVTYAEGDEHETDIIKIFKVLIDRLSNMFGGRGFQQTVGIPMGINYIPL